MLQTRTVCPEIQGLRAVAVGLVLLFHIWPAFMPGGYVGVDVFFVISGYLMTGLLVRSAMRDGSVSLIDFYSRRARRLLPAATTVLAASFLATFAFLPQTRWLETVPQIAASALYVQNWALARSAVDYLGAENAASPVQHYWSLSIEEQFYFIWPLVVIAALHFARRFGVSLRRTLLVALGLIFVGSLAASIYITAQDPARAYFVTHTRIWELALGGLLALTIHRIVFLRHGGMPAAALIFGLAAIVWSAFAYSSATQFPGTAALVPTLGAALVIAAGDVRLGAFRGLNASWLSWIGDRSYSIYLWHGLLVVICSVNIPTIGLGRGIGLIALSLVIAHFSYLHIEQRYRYARKKADWLPLGFGFASIIACVAAAAALQHWMLGETAVALKSGPRYPGPAALLRSVEVPQGVDAIPALQVLKRDLPAVYSNNCHQDQKSAVPKTCDFGDVNGKQTVVLVGDSHAAQWVAALDIVAKAQGWKLVSITKSACPFNRIHVQKSGKPYPSCEPWRENALNTIRALGASIVFTSQSRYGDIDHDTQVQGLRSLWQDLTSAGIDVIAIRDTPWMPFEPGDCLAGGNPAACTAPRRQVEASTIYREAAADLTAVRVIDLTDGICGPETCETIVGNVIVWRDRHHLTTTYATALAPHLAKQAGFPLAP